MGTTRRYTGCGYVYLRYKLTGNDSKVDSPFAQQVTTRITIRGEGAALYDRYIDEWLIAEDEGLEIMLNEHHQTATCMSATVIVGLSVLARQTKNARLLVQLVYPVVLFAVFAFGTPGRRGFSFRGNTAGILV